jgi:hypothetical protein
MPLLEVESSPLVPNVLTRFRSTVETRQGRGPFLLAPLGTAQSLTPPLGQLRLEFGPPPSHAPTVRSLSDMSKALNRAPVYVGGLQARFELPVLEGAAYSNAYFELLRTIIALRSFNIPEEGLRDLWHLEKKLLQLLYVDSTGSRTWFLDSCGATTHLKRRLLLTNHDLGIPLSGSEVQTGLNFADSLPELFAGKEMGEDALRVLRACLRIRAQILAELSTELPHVRTAIRWAAVRARHGGRG